MAEWYEHWRLVLILAIIAFVFVLICFVNVLHHTLKSDKSKWFGILPLAVLIPTNFHGASGRKWLYLLYVSSVIFFVLLFIVIKISPNSKWN
jgi:hypothetical protein